MLRKDGREKEKERRARGVEKLNNFSELDFLKNRMQP